MKPAIKAALIGVTITTVTFLSVLTFIPRESRAATPGGGEQYKLVEYKNAGDSNAGLEGALNKLGEQGWKVRAVLGADVIMAK